MSKPTTYLNISVNIGQQGGFGTISIQQGTDLDVNLTVDVGAIILKRVGEMRAAIIRDLGATEAEARR